MLQGKTWQGVYSRTTRRRFLKGTAAGAGAIALIACGGSSNDTALDQAGDPLKPGSVWFSSNDWKLADETSAAVKGGVYRSVRSDDQAGHYDAMSLVPSQAPSASHTHEQLMGRNRGIGVDPKGGDSGVPVPVLAESMELSPDGTTVTFKMRPGVKWHNVAPVNGRTMDIDDWKTSLDRFLASSPQRVPLQEVLQGATYPDARTMVWKLNFPFAPLMDIIWHERFAFPMFAKEQNANPGSAETALIGTGYKILDKHNRGIGLEYRKNPDYWGGAPFIDRWHTPIIPEYSNRYAQFVNDNILDFGPNARDVMLLAKDAPGAVIVAQEIPDGRAAKIRFGQNNNTTMPWKDPRVRIAIKRSIDFRSIGLFVSNKDEFERNGIPVELLPSTHVPIKPAYWLNPEKGELGALSDNHLFNVAEAKKLMSAAGFNSAVDIDYYVLPGSDGVIPEEEQLVTDALSASGTFKLNIVRSVNTVVHRNCRSLGQCDGIVSSGSGDDYDADRAIYRDYHSQGNAPSATAAGGSSNPAGVSAAYPDPRIDRVAEAQRRELDVNKRIEYIKEFQRLTAEIMPLVPFVHQYTTFRFRWPYLHNSGYGYPGAGLPEGRPVWGGHKHWLDANMPNRERGGA